jgi:hypothetical protein
MRLRWRLVGLAVAASIVAPAGARAQFEALRLVDLPAIGAWAEYQVTRRNPSQRQVLRQRVAYIARQVVGGEEFDWFQIEMESDDYGQLRLPVVTQLALRRADAESRRDLYRKMRELVVQIRAGDLPPFRLGRDLLDVGMERALLAGGSAGPGSDVEYAFRDLEPATVPSPLGDLACRHVAGSGKAEVVLSPEDGRRYPVDTELELWYTPEVPFGLVRQSLRTSGKGPQSETLSLTIDSEEVTELVACGTGAQSATRGPVLPWDPALLRRLAAK